MNINRKEGITNDQHYRTKYILKTRNTFEVGMHLVHRGSINTEEKSIPESEGMHFHYRDRCITGDCRDSSVEDKTARRFGNQLWQRVNKVCGEIFEDGVCPFKKYFRPNQINKI